MKTITADTYTYTDTDPNTHIKQQPEVYQKKGYKLQSRYSKQAFC